MFLGHLLNDRAQSFLLGCNETIKYSSALDNTIPNGLIHVPKKSCTVLQSLPVKVVRDESNGTAKDHWGVLV